MSLAIGSWPANGIVYQIYPRSFFDSNSDGTGDLKGIIEKLDYLNGGTEKSLGINTIWISPVYPSPMFDFGYDISNYNDIDPVFGSIDDFKVLIEESHRRGLKVIMDYIPNHTSFKHPWFEEAKSSRVSPKRDWYIWADPKTGNLPPSNWLSVFGGSAWEYDETTRQYYLHSFLKEQPDLNWRNPQVVEEMLKVLRFWLDLGVDGFRVDAIYHLFKDPKLRDEPRNPAYMEGRYDPYDQLIHQYTFAQPEVLGAMKLFTKTLKHYGPKLVVTEAYTNIDELLKMYDAVKDEYFSPFNFGLITLPWKARSHKDYIDEYDKKIGPLFLPNFVLGNHDRARIASRAGEHQSKIAAMLLLTLRGIPFIYYGDELAMVDTPIPREKIKDTFEKNMPGLGLGRDPERTPMQWSDKYNSGFSTSEPWLPVNENYKEVNVEKEFEDGASILNLYKKLIRLRNSSKALISGKYSSWQLPADEIFAYSRNSGSETKIIILNYSNQEQSVSLPFHSATIICSSYMDDANQTIDLSNFVLRANEGVIAEIS